MSCRYYVSTDRVEHGCCHGAVVLDREDQNGPGSYGGKHDSVVAECPFEEVAQRIADALNKEEE